MDRQMESDLLRAYDLVLACGEAATLEGFTLAVLQGVHQVCPFERGVIYFFDGNGRLQRHRLFNYEKNWVSDYFEYYSKIQNARYQIPMRIPEIGEEVPFLLENSFVKTPWVPHAPKSSLRVLDWSAARRDEFVRDHVGGIGARYSLGFGLFDREGLLRLTFIGNRTSATPYAGAELRPISLAIPHLNALYSALSRQPAPRQRLPEGCGTLTPREREITQLLCEGISTQNICRRLKISQNTLYVHTSHIFQKLQVSSRQELLSRFLNS